MFGDTVHGLFSKFLSLYGSFCVRVVFEWRKFDFTNVTDSANSENDFWNASSSNIVLLAYAMKYWILYAE